MSVPKTMAVRHSERLTNPTRQRGPSVARGAAKQRAIEHSESGQGASRRFLKTLLVGEPCSGGATVRGTGG